MSKIVHTKCSLDQLIEWSFAVYLIAVYLFDLNPTYIFISYASFLLFAILVTMKIIKTGKIFSGKYLVYTFSFVLYSFISVFWASSFEKAIDRSITMLLVFILYFFIFNAFFQRNKLDFLVKVHLISGLCLSLYSVFYYGWNNIINAMLNNVRLGGEISQANVFGMQLAITVVICFYYFIIQNKKIMIPLSILPFILAMSSGSRKALLVICVGLITLIFIKYDFKRIFKLILGIVLAISFFVVISQIPLFNNVFYRIEGLFAVFSGIGKPEASAQVRQTLIELGWRWYTVKPLVGYGLNNSGNLILLEKGVDTYFHNNFIEVLINGGAIGFFLFYSIYVQILSKTVQAINNKQNKITIILILIFIRLILDYASVSYYEKTTWIFFALGFLAISENRIYKS